MASSAGSSPDRQSLEDSGRRGSVTPSCGPGLFFLVTCHDSPATAFVRIPPQPLREDRLVERPGGEH